MTPAAAIDRAKLHARLVAALAEQVQTPPRLPEVRTSKPAAASSEVGRPISFAAPLVRALLDGRKTQTRRPADGRPAPARVGERLWVRERFADDPSRPGQFLYEGDDPGPSTALTTARGRVRWKPSLHLPRHAARLFLDVTSVLQQPLGEMTAADAIAEGCPPDWMLDPLAWFAGVWDSFYADRALGFAADRVVWVMNFRLHRG